jgi:hypothetical protein
LQRHRRNDDAGFFGEETAMLKIHLGGSSRKKGGLVTLATVVGLSIAIAATLFGKGAANHAVASFDASSWLFSNGKGEVARVNGVTGRVDTRTKITDAAGHTMQVSQSDRYVILRDLNTGKVSVLDLSSLALGAAMQTTPGLGVTVAVHDDVAFIIDAVQGQVRQLNPATLSPIGQTLSFPPGISGGTFDDSGRLWLLVPSEGTVVAIEPAKIPNAKSVDLATANSPAPGGQGGGAAASPTIIKTVDVADPSHDLVLSILDTGVAVLDKTATVLTTLRGTTLQKVTLALSGPGAMPSRTVGGDVPVTVVDDGHVYVVNGSKVSQFTVPGTNPKLQPCVAWNSRFYCTDDTSGTVYVIDKQGKLKQSFGVPNSGQPLELEAREDHLFINAPSGSTASVVDDHNNLKKVDKYANGVLGGDLPPAPPPPPPSKPPVGPPGAPAKVTATAGNATAHITWAAAPPNGAAIMKYVVEGDGQPPHEVGANQRALDVAGLTNGTEYRFTVYAVNAKGNGPKRSANPVVPTSQVPDAPPSVAATANADGSVAVTWPAANGQGHKITHYTVTTVTTAGEPKTFDTTTPSLTTKAGDLDYGTQVAFKVVAVNDIGASSVSSPLSPSVVPYNKPDPLKTFTVKANTKARGTVTASWAVPADNGAAITGYEATVNGTKKTLGNVTTADFNGFADNTAVTIAISAVNKAGPATPVTKSASTLAAPTVKLLANPAVATNSITVNFTADVGGGTPPTCTVAVSGGKSASNNCGDAIAVSSGIWPGNTYSFTLTVKNSAGMTATASGTTSTSALTGKVVCGDASYCGKGAAGGGIWVYKAPHQVDADSVDDVFAPTSYEAICKVTGEYVSASHWGGTDTDQWIKIKFPGTQQNYIPGAWFDVDTSKLPGC